MCSLPGADARERRYEAEGTGTMYLFRLDARSVIDATHKARRGAGGGSLRHPSNARQ